LRWRLDVEADADVDVDAVECIVDVFALERYNWRLRLRMIHSI